MVKSRWWKVELAGACALALAAASAVAGQVTLYEAPGLQGRSMTTDDAVPVAARSVFNGVASSIAVRDGTWEACTEPYYRGTCAQLVPGNYSRLADELRGYVASVRQIGHTPPDLRIALSPDSSYTVSAPIVVSPDSTPVVVNSAPIIVESTPREVIVSGEVVPAGPRVVLYQHTTIPERVATVRPVPTGRAVLYEYQNYAGHSALVAEGRAPDLDWANFRNPATSLRIEAGTWLVCSDIGYQGECRILEPGDYPVLSGLMDHGIASARQIWRPEYGARAWRHEDGLLSRNFVATH